MNLNILLGLIKGSNAYETAVKILTIVAGFLAGVDSNKEGNDDLVAGGLYSVAAAIEAYGQQDDNEHGNIVDGMIAGLQEYREQMIALGKIYPVNSESKAK